MVSWIKRLFRKQDDLQEVEFVIEKQRTALITADGDRGIIVDVFPVQCGFVADLSNGSPYEMTDDSYWMVLQRNGKIAYDSKNRWLPINGWSDDELDDLGFPDAAWRQREMEASLAKSFDEDKEDDDDSGVFSLGEVS